MNPFLFILVIFSSFIVVRIGAVAFQLTGLEWSLAKFQALSCFTGTGFTTKEAELITGNRQRRQIASILMVLGNAGLVTLIATFANSLRPDESVHEIFGIVISNRIWPWLNLAVMVVAFYVIYRIFTSTTLAKKITEMLRKRMTKGEFMKPVLFEELLVAAGGYGVSKVDVSKDSPIVDQTLAESQLRAKDITVLAIERMGTTMANPPASTRITTGDDLICFGKLSNIREFCGTKTG